MSAKSPSKSSRRANSHTSPHSQSNHKSSEPSRKLKIALVCDWLTTPGGAEKVLLELHHMYPAAPIYTSQYSQKGIDWFNDATVKTGWLQIFPKSFRKFLGPLRQIYFRHLDLSAYDLVISVTGAEAKAVRTRPKNTKKVAQSDLILPLYHTSSKKSIEKPSNGAYHLCYCHVPTQYYWQMYDRYLANPGFGFLNPLVRFVLKILIKPLRRADFNSAQLPDQFVTISTYASEQIQKYYHRSSVIVAPPVDLSKFHPASPTKTSTKPSSHQAKSSKIRPNSTAFPPSSGDFSTESPEKSTNFPPVNRELSTKTSDFSTKSKNLSTDNPQNSTVNPPLIHQNSNFIHRFSTALKQVFHPNSALFHRKTTTNPPKPETYPQLIHHDSTTYPQNPHTFPPQIHSQDQVFPQNSNIFPPYYIIACRQVNWKRVDLAISACIKAKLPLLVVGDGAEHDRLVKLAAASPYIHFLPWASQSELAQYLQNAKAYLFPSLEPFGIAAVEALAAGCPVIAYREGGSQDFIKDGENGLLFSEQSVASLTRALRQFEHLSFDRRAVSRSAEQFSAEHFQRGIKKLIKGANL